jgi:hypothetical protein
MLPCWRNICPFGAEDAQRPRVFIELILVLQEEAMVFQQVSKSANFAFLRQRQNLEEFPQNRRYP